MCFDLPSILQRFSDKTLWRYLILNSSVFAAQDEQSSIAESVFLLWISLYDHYKSSQRLHRMEVCQTLKHDRGPDCSLSLHIREIIRHRGKNDNLEINKRDHTLCQHGTTFNDPRRHFKSYLIQRDKSLHSRFCSMLTSP